MARFTTTIVSAALAALVSAHGSITDPPARQAGSAYEAACGQQPFNQQSADKNGNIQGIEQVVGDDFNAAECNLWLCKGFQFDDNTDNVQTFTAGETVPITVGITAPHTGVANVSVVQTSTNSVIGSPLISFTNYASNAGMDANNTNFDVTIPTDLGSQCATAGDCVLQWFWDAADINQTYESCVDFVVSGSGSGTGSGSASSAAASVASSAAASVAPASAVPAAVTTTPAATPTTFATVTRSTTAAAAEATDDCDDEDVDEEDATTTTTAAAAAEPTDECDDGEEEDQTELDDDCE
ncbi:Chitin binding domain [Geosmithia morbida]|uniref:Chitin binding domain n=1 Tax=Geosmithia morbida TaxID=1094350 RepID=A0A9P4YNW9_9HYPO|nr:Chitin binding domain [Geosmithia morbida]KAF4119350.1 Chitin binding domain [Geosmithia morbida]